MDNYIQLKWNAHSSVFVNNLCSLRDQQVFTDVTLSCGNQFYPAHRLVLSSCSSFFAKALEMINCRSPVLLLHGIEQFILERLLMFMYDGQVTITQKDLPSFLKAAHWLGLKGLDMPNNNPEYGDNDKPFVDENIYKKSEAGKYMQIWMQLLSPFLSSADGTPSYEDLTSLLHQILSKWRNGDEDNPVGDVIVSNVTSLSKEPASRFDFEINNEIETHVEPELVVKIENSEMQMNDDDDAVLAASSLEPAIVEAYQLDCADSFNDDNGFEGWEHSDQTVSNHLTNLRQHISQNTIEEKKDLNFKQSSGQSLKGDGWNDSQLIRKRSLCCKYCKSRFTARKELAKHLRTHQHKFCYTCNKRFLNSKRYILHMKLHDKGATYNCKDCGFVSLHKNGLASHVRATMHGQVSSGEDNSKNKLENMEEDNVDQLSGSVLKCRICGFRSNHTRGIKRHITCMHSKSAWKKLRVSQDLSLVDSETSCCLYNCTMCSFSSNHMRGLKRHVTCKHMRPLVDESEISPEQESVEERVEKEDSSSYKFCCKICNFTSMHRRGFRKHMSCIHNNVDIQQQENEGELPHMGKEDSSKLALRSSTRRFYCSSCKSSFDSLVYFQKHKMLGCLRYRCKYCDVKFSASERQEYLDHIADHKDVVFKCSYCPYQTDRKRSLSDHMSKHTSNYRFYCPWCSFKCMRNNMLSAHINKFHGNEVSEQELENQDLLFDKNLGDTSLSSFSSKANGVIQNLERIEKSVLPLLKERSERHDVTCIELIKGEDSKTISKLELLNEVSDQELENQDLLFDKDIGDTPLSSFSSKANGVNQNLERIEKGVLHLPQEKNESHDAIDLIKGEDSETMSKLELPTHDLQEEHIIQKDQCNKVVFGGGNDDLVRSTKDT